MPIDLCECSGLQNQRPEGWYTIVRKVIFARRNASGSAMHFARSHRVSSTFPLTRLSPISNALFRLLDLGPVRS